MTANIQDRKYNCNTLSLLEDRKCMFEGKCRHSMVVYKLDCKSYIGKTQHTLKARIKEHLHDTWKVIKSGRNKFGDDWFVSGGYACSDAFSKYCANLCRDFRTSNQVRALMKQMMVPTILRRGEGGPLYEVVMNLVLQNMHDEKKRNTLPFQIK